MARRGRRMQSVRLWAPGMACCSCVLMIAVEIQASAERSIAAGRDPVGAARSASGRGCRTGRTTPGVPAPTMHRRGPLHGGAAKACQWLRLQHPGPRGAQHRPRPGIPGFADLVGRDFRAGGPPLGLTDPREGARSAIRQWKTWPGLRARLQPSAYAARFTSPAQPGPAIGPDERNPPVAGADSL